MFNESLIGKLIKSMEKQYLGITVHQHNGIDNIQSVELRMQGAGVIYVRHTFSLYKDESADGFVSKSKSHTFNNRLASILKNYYNLDYHKDYELIEAFWMQYVYNNIDIKSVKHINE